MQPTRRELLVGGAAASALALGSTPSFARRFDPLFEISLAQWSLHRTLRSGQLNPLAFPAFAKGEFDIDAVEYVNQFFANRAVDFAWLGELKKRAEDAGVKSLLIMIDGEGALAARDDGLRRRAVHDHFKWIAAARFLGCHSIRVNAAGSAGQGDWEDARDRAAESLRLLGEVGDEYGIDVIVENHGGLSSNGQWLAEVMRAAGHERVGTLPDFGNFQMAAGEWYDRYQGVHELMPWARAVSAKSHEFDAGGNEVNTDYRRMLSIVLEAGYKGYVGIEYEGTQVPEAEGIRRTKKLLERVRSELAGDEDE